jgi:hypothetical protein
VTLGVVLAITGATSPAVGASTGDSVVRPPTAVRVSDEILDVQAHARVTYEGSVNIASFQQDGLLTFGEYQYTAWYRADGRAVVGRRALPSGDWSSIELGGFLAYNDSHNTISMAVSPSDGRLHLALGTHGGAQLYIRSAPGLANGDLPWSSLSFEPLRQTIPFSNGGSSHWTYPQFELADGQLLLTYREGSSNNGRQALARYNDDEDGTWTYLGLFTDSSGTYTSPFGSSESRYSYLHGFGTDPATGDLVVTFTWREQTSAWCAAGGLGNHDLGYARSPDGGMTWLNNDGAVIGRTGTADRISVTDPHVVVDIPINQGMINQEAQTFDSLGRVHVMTSQFNDEDLAKLGGCHTSTYSQRKQYAKPFHHWRDASGTWHSMELPFYNNSAGRTKLLFDRSDTAYLVLPDGRIATATARSEWTDWKIVFDDPEVKPLAETIVDRKRLRSEGVLSVAYLQAGNGVASDFRVADFRTKPGRPIPSAARSTEAEQEPVPYEGSAVNYPRAVASSSQRNYPADYVVDGSTSTFWVSGGTAEGQGPQPDRPETLTIEYGADPVTDTVSIGTVTVTPRPGYGPRTFRLEALVDGAWRDLGAFEQAGTAATYDVDDVEASRLRLVITSSYDGARPPERSRNVQVAEVTVTAP